MGLTRYRDLIAAAAAAAVFGYLVVHTLYRYFPPITGWTGLSLLAVAAAGPALSCAALSCSTIRRFDAHDCSNDNTCDHIVALARRLFGEAGCQEALALVDQ